MSEIFEILMIVSFGISWPINVMKSIKTRSTKGKSIFFLIMIFLAYVFGIISKLTAPVFKWYIAIFYVFNLIMVSCDIILYTINYSREKRLAE